MKKIYKLHKWIGVIIGVFILVQCITGIIFFLPFPEVVTNKEPDLSLDYYRSMKISPSEAVEILNEDLGLPIQIKNIYLKQINESVVYEISTMSGNIHLIDSLTGKIIKITPEFARQIALDKFAGSSNILKIEKIDWKSPVYRIVFDDKWTSSLFISALNGELVRKSNRIVKIRSFILRFHDMSILTTITKQGLYGKIILIISAFTSIVLIGTGYYLFIMFMRKKRHSISR